MPVYVVPVLDFRICVLKSRIMIILESVLMQGKLWSWKSLKFVYDDGDQPFAVIYKRRLDLKAFRFDKTGEIAPRAVQKYLENKKIVIAIEKGLIILGY